MKKIKAVALLLVFSFSLIFLVGCYKNENNEINSAESKTDIYKMETEYIGQLKNILNNYQNKYIKIDKESGEINKWSELIDETKEQILDLRVTSNYKDLHLNLFLSLNLIEQGILDEDQNKVEEGLNKFEALYSEVFDK